MKLLLYYTKAKNKYDRLVRDEHYGKPFYLYGAITENFESLNGKIVAECDYEVDKLTNCGTSFRIMKYDDMLENYRYTNGVARGSCLDYNDLRKYLGNKDGYAIHIKNLNVFDKPRELNECWANTNAWIFDNERLDIAPQNMRYCGDWNLEKAILISIKPEWLCKILNGEKTIEVRRKVLKEMK